MDLTTRALQATSGTVRTLRCESHPQRGYSYLSAMIGSTLLARRAGSQLANRPANARMAIMVANASGKVDPIKIGRAHV